MRVILITGEDIGHRYVANKLASAVELAGIVVDRGTARRRRWRRLWKRYTMGQLFSRACLRLLATVRRDGVHRHNRILEALGAENCSNFLFPRLVTPVHGINSREGEQVVSSLQPDVILVFGTVMVKESLLSLARNISLNLHTGISPHYRGADCDFWPLYNNELHMLGATIHKCTMQVDGGAIFATGHACLQAHDDLYSVFARCLMIGTDLYVDVVKGLIDGRLEACPQNLSIGREYKVVMRNVRADLKVRRQIKNGLVRRYVLAKDTQTVRPRMTA